MKVKEIELLTKAEINSMSTDELRNVLMTATAASNRRLSILRAEDRKQDTLKKKLGVYDEDNKTYGIPALREFEQNIAFRSVHEMFGGKFSASTKLSDNQMREMLQLEVRFLDYKTSTLKGYREKIEIPARKQLVEAVKGVKEGESGWLSALRSISKEKAKELWTMYGQLKELHPEDFVLGSPGPEQIFSEYEQLSDKMTLSEKVESIAEKMKDEYEKTYSAKSARWKKLASKVGIHFK